MLSRNCGFSASTQHAKASSQDGWLGLRRETFIHQAKSRPALTWSEKFLVQCCPWTIRIRLLLGSDEGLRCLYTTKFANALLGFGGVRWFAIFALPNQWLQRIRGDHTQKRSWWGCTVCRSFSFRHVSRKNGHQTIEAPASSLVHCTILTVFQRSIQLGCRYSEIESWFQLRSTPIMDHEFSTQQGCQPCGVRIPCHLKHRDITYCEHVQALPNDCPTIAIHRKRGDKNPEKATQ